MARLHQLVAAAAETTNLEELASLLIEACQIAQHQGLAPYATPEIRFICWQIAFSGDGDIDPPIYYRQVLEFCSNNVDNETPKGKPPSEPPRTTS